MAEFRVSDDLKATYADYYRDDDSRWRQLGALGKADNIVALCSGLPQRAILEIGAGEGAVLQRLSELAFGERLCAVEISESGVEAIKKRNIPRLAEARVFDGYHLPYDAGVFDIAILSHVLEHVEHPRKLLCESARVARWVFIEVPLEDISRAPRDYRPTRVGHINFFSRRTIRWLVQTCGLRVVRERTANAPRETYEFQGGRGGLVHYYLKQLLLDFWPKMATRHFCYHEALLSEREIC